MVFEFHSRDFEFSQKIYVYAEIGRKDPAIELLYECNYLQNS